MSNSTLGILVIVVRNVGVVVQVGIVGYVGIIILIGIISNVGIIILIRIISDVGIIILIGIIIYVGIIILVGIIIYVGIIILIGIIIYVNVDLRLCYCRSLSLCRIGSVILLLVNKAEKRLNSDKEQGKKGSGIEKKFPEELNVRSQRTVDIGEIKISGICESGDALHGADKDELNDDSNHCADRKTATSSRLDEKDSVNECNDS